MEGAQRIVLQVAERGVVEVVDGRVNGGRCRCRRLCRRWMRRRSELVHRWLLRWRWWWCGRRLECVRERCERLLLLLLLLLLLFKKKRGERGSGVGGRRDLRCRCRRELLLWCALLLLLLRCRRRWWRWRQRSAGVGGERGTLVGNVGDLDGFGCVHCGWCSGCWLRRKAQEFAHMESALVLLLVVGARRGRFVYDC